METERKTKKWKNDRVYEEYEVKIYEYKGESKEIRTGKSKKFENDGTLKEECDYEITTYHDREGISFYGHSMKTKKVYNINGELLCTESWVPEYDSPYNGPASLHTFTLKERNSVD